MNIQFDRPKVLKGLIQACNVAEKKTTMPMLGNLHLEAKGEHLSIAATDLEIGIEFQTGVLVRNEGSFCLPANQFLSIIKELPEDIVEMDIENQGWVSLRCGASQFKIASVSPEDFPKLQIPEGTTKKSFSRSVMFEAIERTAFAISTDELRYNLNGAWWEPSGQDQAKNFKLVSTDGHRLALYECELEGAFENVVKEGAILPRKGILELKKLLAEIDDDAFEYAIDQGQAVFWVGGTCLSMRLVAGDFPNYGAVIPKGNDKAFECDKKALVNCLRRVSLLSEGKSKCVKFSFQPGSVEVSANTPEIGEAKETIEGEHQGEELTIGFNAKYLLDALSVVTDERVVISLNRDDSPAILHGQSNNKIFSVIMPMRI